MKYLLWSVVAVAASALWASVVPGLDGLWRPGLADETATAAAQGDVTTVGRCLTQFAPARLGPGPLTAALAAAAAAGHGAVVRMLLRDGADPNGRLGDSAPLHFAARADDVDALQALLAAGADANAQTSRGCTPLMVAVTQGNPRAVACLIRAGADARPTTRDGDSALDLAWENVTDAWSDDTATLPDAIACLALVAVTAAVADPPTPRPAAVDASPSVTESAGRTLKY